MICLELFSYFFMKLKKIIRKVLLIDLVEHILDFKNPVAGYSSMQGANLDLPEIRVHKRFYQTGAEILSGSFSGFFYLIGAFLILEHTFLGSYFFSFMQAVSPILLLLIIAQIIILFAGDIVLDMRASYACDKERRTRENSTPIYNERELHFSNKQEISALLEKELNL